MKIILKTPINVKIII